LEATQRKLPPALDGNNQKGGRSRPPNRKAPTREPGLSLLPLRGINGLGILAELIQTQCPAGVNEKPQPEGTGAKLFARPSVRTRRKLTDTLFRPIAQRESTSKLPPAKPRMQAGGTQDHQHADKAGHNAR
jgi:hypothetical protein